MNIFRELYNYRQMIFSLVKRDLRGRYKGSVFGFLWTFLNPLLQLVVYTFVFSFLLKSEIENYYLFLFVALIPWLFFSTAITGGSGSVLHQSGMVTKIYFPREVLPISHVTSAFINMLYSFIVVFIVIIIARVPVSPVALLYLPIVMIVEYFLALGITMLVSAITVYFRDLEFILSIFMMAWQYLTPVMYSVDIVPEHLMKLFMLNPMTPITIAYRDILYYAKAPDLSTLLLAIGMSAAFMLIGFWAFGKLKKRFAEEM
ncbi:MAG: ABC transporter permease [Clostridiales bacterium]|nr:ABC transporter permease [Clostridiales bacterium]